MLSWLWSGDPGGETTLLLNLGLRAPRPVEMLGWLWSGDPGGETLFLLHFRPRASRLRLGAGLGVFEKPNRLWLRV